MSVSVEVFEEWLRENLACTQYIHNYDYSFMKRGMWEEENLEDAISDAFRWEDTDQGFDYWDDLNDEWLDYLDSYKSVVPMSEKLKDAARSLDEEGFNFEGLRQPAWKSGEGLPPIGSTQDDCRITAEGFDYKEFEVVAHVDGKAIVYVSEAGDVSLVNEWGFDLPISKERLEATEKLHRATPLTASLVDVILDALEIY